MEEEKQLSNEESLQLIATMINKAKSDYVETGISALLWGTITTFCALLTFANNWWHQNWINYIWLLSFFAVVPQIIISIRESKMRKLKSYQDDAIGGVWMSFGICIFLLSFWCAAVNSGWGNTNSLYLILYGIPTFTSGYARRFRPMILGGIACWIFSIASVYILYPYSMLLIAAGAQLAWFIPGLILRKRYLTAKHQNV
jgi:hypothetical protein